ncbi:MAG: T9SS type A sorting domain-containing protein [Bacteroidota bacterium]
MKMKFILVILSFISGGTLAQTPDYAFTFRDSIPVINLNSDTFSNAWQGGINFCQYNSIDINLDGIPDLVTFDRSGNRLGTFINNGQPQNNYHYDPSYISLFPKMHDWMLIEDYNGDGKQDIFTYSSGGTSIFKNVSTLAGGLKFTLVCYVLNSWMGGPQPINLYINSVDIPAITDIDHDGDLDILTFGPLGSYLQYHRNQSVELYGNRDSLDFILEENCWGDFAESASSNTLTLGITCPLFVFSENENEKSKPKHTGSTMLALDLDNDFDKDLIIGDVSYSNLVALYNGGDTTYALGTSQDTLFPVYNTSIDISSFPAVFSLDLNNDGVRDLVAAPNDQLVSENQCRSWYFKNNGSNEAPVYNLQTKNFMKESLIDLGEGAFPVFFDYNNDSLMDIVVSNNGYWMYSWDSIGNVYSKYRSQLALFKNTGTKTQPAFALIDTNYANIASLNITAAYPSFGDLDNDGAFEMIVGNSDGKLYFYENTAGAGNPATFTLAQSSWMNIDVGKFSTPQLIDIDRDGLLELICGERSGKLFYFDNTGTLSSPLFSSSPTNSSFGNVNVTDYSLSNYGYSAPCFFDDNGDFRLFSGSYAGRVYYYKNIDGNLNGSFTKVDTSFGGISEGMRSAVSLYNINNDSYMDMVIGNYAGGISFYKGILPEVGIDDQQSNSNDLLFQVYPNPANNRVTISLNDQKSKGALVQIFNISGMLVYSAFSDEQSFSLSIENFESGLYLVNVICSNSYGTRRLSITH